MGRGSGIGLNNSAGKRSGASKDIEKAWSSYMAASDEKEKREAKKTLENSGLTSEQVESANSAWMDFLFYSRYTMRNDEEDKKLEETIEFLESVGISTTDHKIYPRDKASFE